MPKADPYEYLISKVKMDGDYAERLTRNVLLLLKEEHPFNGNNLRHAILDVFDELTGKEAEYLTMLIMEEDND